MKAARLFDYNQPLKVAEVPEPEISGPFDVIVRIAGAGVCRTDLHLVEAVWKDALGNPSLPYTLGHENAGWVEEVGSAVTHLAKGDPVILHPLRSCGFCRACRAGNDMHCASASFPGLDGTDGGFAEYLKTSARAVIKLAPGTDPASLAPFADAGVTAYHAVKKIAPATYPGSTAVVVGIGGLGHFAIQLLRVMTTARVVALDTRPERLDFARSLGADEAFHSALDGGVEAILADTGGMGADVILDFVGEHGTPNTALKMLRKGGTYSVIGYGGAVEPTTLEMISKELTIVGNLVGSYNDLAELMELNRQGKVRIAAHQFPLEEAADVLRLLDAGQIEGRAVLVPPRAAAPSAREAAAKATAAAR
jgi:D-arabinose 1-dehydrogenase-like Zn-dependent alcohol dehydrogenase